MNEYGILNNFDILSNFWKENPEFLIIKEFQEFHLNDKSKAKERGSKVMWAIALLVHPKSKFFQSQYEERKKIIQDDYLSFEALNWDLKYSNLISRFKEVALTRIQRNAAIWSDKFDERMDFLKSTKYTIDTFNDLDKAMQSTDKIWNVFIKCMKDMEDEESKTVIEGGGVESLSEQGKI
jgi:hypothetical protein